MSLNLLVNINQIDKFCKKFIFGIFKGALYGLIQFLATENPFKNEEKFFFISP